MERHSHQNPRGVVVASFIRELLKPALGFRERYPYLGPRMGERCSLTYVGGLVNALRATGTGLGCNLEKLAHVFALDAAPHRRREPFDKGGAALHEPDASAALGSLPTRP